MDKRPRIKTRYPGVAYRERADGSRQHMIWFEGTDGKGHWQNTTGGLQDAVKTRARIVDRIAHGHKVAPSKVLFADFARTWLEEQTNLRPKSIETYRTQIESHLVPRLGPKTRLSDVDVDRVARLIASMRKDGLKAWTIRTTLTPLSRIMTTAVRRGLAPANPVPQLERSERPQGDQAQMNILDTDEIRLLLANADRFRTILATAIFTGLRIGELVALRWEDVDFLEGIIRVRSSKTKSGVREVILMPALQRMLAQLEGHEGFVFQNKRGGPMLTDVVRKDGLYPALKGAGIVKRVRFHDLRHTFASILISEGYDLALVAEQMGHASISTTLNTYAKLIDGKQKRDVARERLEASHGEVLA